VFFAQNRNKIESNNRFHLTRRKRRDGDPRRSAKEKMKIFTIIVLALIVVMFVLAGLSEAEHGYGKLGAFSSAATYSSLLVVAYFVTYGYLRKDKYILGAILYSILSSSISLAKISRDTNAFGMAWSVLFIISLNGIYLLIFGVIRILIVAVITRANPFNLPPKQNDNEAEQAGPGYPPQGVGSPDP
jgi:hypothetical protein